MANHSLQGQVVGSEIQLVKGVFYSSNNSQDI